MPRHRRRTLIVDGYNVIRCGSRYRDIPAPDYTDHPYNVARDKLIDDVAQFAGREYKATIVFDGTDNPYSQGNAQKLGNVRVIFSATGVSADKVIEKLSYDAAVRGEEVLVVTSDATIQDTVFGGGVDRMSAEGFCREMGMYFEEVHVEHLPAVNSKNTVEGRIDSSTLAKLKALRDSM